jgi:type IV/VI secretion system ImpK/VasF family protein
MTLNTNESAVIHGFQAFYYELLRQKEKALSLFFTSEQLSPSETTGDDGVDNLKKKNEVEGCVVEIQKKLLTVIVEITNDMLLKSRSSPKITADAKYVMTIFVDEIFLNLKWEGAKIWRFFLLERQLFQTEVSGDKFFSMVDEITTDQTNEEMAFLYLMTLSLGFKGKYRDIEDSDEHLSWYKNRLYSMLHNKPTKLFFPGRSHMIESCYEHTCTENGNSYLPDVRFWSWCIISIAFLYIIISYCVWDNITGEIKDILNKITEQVKQGPLI